MNEIKETLAILKARWHEVTLIIGLWFLHRLIVLTLRTYPDITTLVSFVTISISLFILVVSTGFLRTVYLEQDKRQSLPDLMRIGKHFFWRILGVGILCGLAMMLFPWLLSIIIKGDTISPLVNRIRFPFIQLILAKLTLLIPAIIIVADCSLSKSFGIMWKVKLLKAKPLLTFFLITGIVIPYLFMLFFPGFLRAHSSITWGDAIFILYSTISHIMALMVSVMAVRFVSSLGIDCACQAFIEPPTPSVPPAP